MGWLLLLWQPPSHSWKEARCSIFLVLAGACLTHSATARLTSASCTMMAGSPFSAFCLKQVRTAPITTPRSPRSLMGFFPFLPVTQ
uniref:Putative secreted protein n=1 Tax=Ixodes ricinus TaxID=34613 RepID=A0A6B0U9J7_IXORI